MLSIKAIIVIAIIALLLVANLLATYMAIKSSFNDRAKKAFQTLFVWLVPILGAIFTILANKQLRDYKREKQTGNDTAITDNNAIDLELSSHIGHSNVGGHDVNP